MSEVIVSEVESAAHKKLFITFPNKLYADDKNYVTPLLAERKDFFNTSTNPFFKTARVTLFLARRDGQIVGRIATCLNFRHNELHQEQTGFFGFFDTINDSEVSRKLLKVAMITLKKAGMNRMRGPTNFSTNHECGFLVEGFDSPPMVMMTYNQPYQVRLAEEFGLKKAMDLLAYKLDTDLPALERVQATVAKKMARSNIVIRTLKMKQFDREVRLIKEMYNAAWADNWGFVPMDDEEFDHMAANLKQIIDPNIVIIAEHEGRPVGFSLAVPNINQVLARLNGRLFPTGLIKLLWHTKIRNKIDTCRLITFGVIPEYRKRAIEMMLYLETLRQGVGRGIKWGELSWILESNELMRSGAELMRAYPYKTYRIMEMPL